MTHRAVLISSLMLCACARDPLATCAPVQPNTYSCTTRDGGYGEFVSLAVLTTDLEDGYFRSAPGCVFEPEGSVARFSFDQPFCRSPILGDALGEDIVVVNVLCVVPENGTWTFSEPGGMSVVIERTDAGHRCTR